ncbi:ATP-binding protein [Abyssalbus ytuae]|uniref:histidine kinase n=1 Tax=Abyssalbus ytuae TaxID=2926907 RepID=A0A9E6ZS70_9FLAO|nr:sensor histidine kinase [Abyssalbus ytuae]UOB16888.1 sensor histidine kinase [Abyssalbus ytuae]
MPVIDSINYFIKEANQKTLDYKIRGMWALKARYLVPEIPDSLKPRYYYDIAISFYRIKDFEKYHDISLKALKSAKKNEKDTIYAESLYNLAYYYLNKNYRSDSAYFYFNEMEKAYSKIKDTLKIGQAILNKGIVQQGENDYFGAQATVVRAIPYFEIVKDDRFLSSAYNTLANLDIELGEYNNAIQNHQKALAYRRKLENKYLEAHSLNNIGVVYKEQKKYDKAIEYYSQALSYKNLYEEKPLFYAKVLDNLAYAKFKSGIKSDLPTLFYKAFKIKDSLKDFIGILSSKIKLAEYFEENNKKDSAKFYAYEAKELAEKLKLKDEQLKVLSVLSRLESEEKALAFSQQYIAISDSLQMQERTSRNQFARIRFETDQIVSENEKITREKELLVFVIAILFTLGLLLYIIIKQMNQNKELMYQQQQQQANEEIYNLMLSQQIKLEEGRQLEKQRISRDLHDGVLGSLFGTRLSLESLILRDTQNSEEKSRHIRELKKIEQEIRNISHDLSSELFSSDLGYVEVVEKLIKTQTSITNLDFEFINNADIKWDRVSSKVKIHLYRIIQEALQNINKHAHATKVRVKLLENKKSIHLEIVDNGVGFKVDKTKGGIGLKNIETRVLEVSGKINITSEKNKGTTMTINVPLQ